MDNRRRGVLLLMVGLMIGLAAAPLPALAYLDPVTGSFVVQGLIAGVLAVVASLRSFREWLLRLVRRRPKPQAPAAGKPSPEASPTQDREPPDA